jgi:hypothetical protein
MVRGAHRWVVLPGRYTVTLAARGKSVSQAVEVAADSRLDIASGALEARHTAAQQLTALEKSFNDGVALHRRLASEYARLDSALAASPARRDTLATLSKTVHQRIDSLCRRSERPASEVRSSISTARCRRRRPHPPSPAAASSSRAKLREDLASLNGLLAGDFAAFQQRASGRW